MKAISLSVVIPAFNEEKTIKKVVLEAAKYAKKITSNFEILVLNDASTDNTQKVLKQIKLKELKIISHKTNQGIEPTLRQLYTLAKNKYCFFNGADGDIDMAVLVPMHRLMFQTNADIVVGNRTSKNYTFKRRIVSNAYNLLTRLMTGTTVYDAGTVKLVKTAYFQNQPLISSTVFAEAERLVLAQRKGAKIEKLDIVQNRNERNDVVSLKQIFLCLLDLVRLSTSFWFSSYPR